MVNSIIAFDSEDGALGDFFSICGTIVNDTVNAVANGTWVTINISSKTLNEINIELKTTQLSKKNFVFSSFTHGDDEALYSNGERLVYCPCDPNHLANSLAFCFACCSGKILGIDLIKTGTLCFVGYKNIVEIWTTYLQIFAECATASIVAFYSGKSVKESLEAKIEKYNNEIDDIYTKNFPVAASLMKNRDAIILHGNDSLTINDFNHN